MEQASAQQLTALVLAVFRLNGALVHWGDDFSAPEGLGSSRWQMLGAVALAEQPLTAPQIAATMGVTRQGAQKQLNLLVQAGLLETRDNPQHKRSPCYVLTPQGRRTHAGVDQRWNRHAARVAASFSAAELGAAASVLTSLLGMHACLEPHHEA